MGYKYSITAKMLDIITNITKFIGQYEGMMHPAPAPMLRRQNRIKTVQGTLAIEGNTLSLDQVTLLLEGKRVIGPPKDILEVENIVKLYEKTGELNIYSWKDFLKAHAILMDGIQSDAGKWRSGSVGILKGKSVSHVAPQAKFVAGLIKELFTKIKKEKISDFIKSAVVHYEIEFIHPFSDGNGRIGRFWQHIMLLEISPLFEFVPFESIIKKRQTNYYKALEIADKNGEATPFIEFTLEAVLEALKQFIDELHPEQMTPERRLNIAKDTFKTEFFSRGDYNKLFKFISTATASRDLALGVKLSDLIKVGEKARTKYKFN
jgi:Fic family protein